MKEGMSGYLADVSEKYNKDGKAAIGINYPIGEADMTELYFYIDEPIKDEELNNIWTARTYLGGVGTLGHTMGKGFYETHKDEISKLEEEYRKAYHEQGDFNDYVSKYFDEITGKKVAKEEEETYYFDYERERAEEKRKRMAGAAKLISELTGGKSIEEVTLQDLEKIKQGLIDRKEQVIKAFAEKFGTKEKE